VENAFKPGFFLFRLSLDIKEYRVYLLKDSGFELKKNPSF